MPDIIVGIGGDYSGENALNDLSADFTSMAGQGIVNVKMKDEGYIYNGGVMLQQTNCDANNHFVFMAYEGQEHKGNFSATCPKVRYFSDEVILATPLNWDGNLKKAWGFFLGSSFHKFKDFIFVGTGLTRPTGRTMVFQNHVSTDILMENILVDRRESTNQQHDEFLASAYGLQFGRPMKRMKVKNCIVANPDETGIARTFNFSGSGTFNYTESGLGADECEVYNSIFYNSKVDFFDLPIGFHNSGSLNYYDGSEMFANSSNVVGGGNYSNGNSVPTGTGYLNITLADVMFIDPENFKFNLRLTSGLIGTGNEISEENPKDIKGNFWQGAHRSPFNNIIVSNAYMQPPEDTEYIRGSWMSGMVLNCTQPFGKYVLGPMVGLPNNLDIYSHAGFITKCENTQIHHTITNYIQKQITISAVLKRFTSGAIIYLFGHEASGFEILVHTNNDNKVRVNVSSDFYAEGLNLSSYINLDDYFNFICQIDLEAVGDERIKVYVYQKGFLHRVSLTLTGTAPSIFEQTTNSWFLATHTQYQGITSVWNRLLAFEEIYTIAYDPYVVYRSDKKLFKLLGIIKSGLNLWFLRKFIMEKR